jgi:hypothetical protein
MMKTKFKDIWLRQERNSDYLTMREQISINGSIDCFIGRIGASNAKMFQIEIDKTILIHRNYLKRFHGVEIRVLELDNNKKNITIILADNDLLDVFILFIRDLISGFENIVNENDIPLILNQKVSYWGKLFAKIKGELLSKEQQRGLFGELTFLNILLKSSSDLAKSLVSWTGPDGSNQDFSSGLSAVEVKTSRATKPSVNITSELQLDWTVLDSLSLYVVHLDEISNGTDTLYKLIKEIKEKLSCQNEVLCLFEEKLNLVGIPLGEETYYGDTGYIIRSQKAYEVREGFPALINNLINNPAIHNVKYQIDLIACQPFEFEHQSIISKMI